MNTLSQAHYRQFENTGSGGIRTSARPDAPGAAARGSRFGFDLDAAIANIGRWLPMQNPIKDFIHHNTLHALQNRPFHEAIAIASRIHGARGYLPLGDYQARHRQGRIADFAIEQAVARVEAAPAARASLRESLFVADEEAHYPPPSLALHGIRQAWLTHLEVNLDALAHPILFRLVANFLDQGISRWSVARAGESFWACLWRLVEGSFVPLYPFAEPEARAMLSHSVDIAIEACLDRLVGDEALHGVYLLEMALAHPGWSGMVHVVERHPDKLLTPREISLKEFLAVELVLELALLRMKRGPAFAKVATVPGIDRTASFAEALDAPPTPTRLRVWQEAMEISLHTELLRGIAQQPPVPASSPIGAQALFCLDDRECSLRRHLEEIDPGIQTFGAAGFFGIEFFYKGLEDLYPVAQCPAVVTPRHLVVETQTRRTAVGRRPPARPGRRAPPATRLMRHWLFTQTMGLGYAAKMAWEVFRPGARPPGFRRLGEVDHPTRLHLHRSTDTPAEDGRLLGFSHPEMADRLEGLFRAIGLTGDFAPIVVVVAHGSSSTNNPHFAAYDCGACAGRPGAPNARAFARMANDARVRALLRERGIDIPDGTLFVAALHNTSRDEITYFDRAEWPSAPPPALAKFQAAMTEALGRNARERCRWFELGPVAPGPAAALAHVRSRAASLFEPRPELNHSNNLYCVVGRRSLTRRLFLDRRAFLHSYDPGHDPEGAILAGILAQVIPVCGGINLEYLFSRIDNSMYGAGTKLPHNVIGLLGVANGMEGDLRTGLPSQMIEVHEPARLLIAVEQDIDRIDRALQRLGGLREWLDHEWVRLASVHPVSRKSHWYEATGWRPVTWPAHLNTPAARCSLDIHEGSSETLPVHVLTGAGS